MQNPQSLDMVADCHNAFQVPVLEDINIDSERAKFRVSLIKEEVGELEQAVEENNLIEIMDALGDIEFVLMGTVLEFGLGDKFCDIFTDIYHSNMSKLCNDLDEANQTVEYYKNEKGIDTYIVPNNDKFVIKRTSDSKFLKSIYYKPVDLTKYLPNAS